MTMLEPNYETISLPSTPEPILPVEEENKDTDYYLEPLSLQISGVTLKVPAYPFLEESETFASKYNIRSNSKGEYQAVLVLDDVNLVEFKHFLHALLPKYSRQEKLKLSTAEWISTLRIATQYRFNDLRKIAIDELSPIDMDPVERVCLAKEFKVPSWLLSGYQNLAERSTTLAEDEASKIGLTTALHLSKVAIHRLRDQLAARDPIAIDDHIREAFRAEFDAMVAAASSYPTTRERLELELEQARALAEKEMKEALDREEREKRLRETEEAKREKEKAKMEAQKREAELKAKEQARLKSERECQLRKLAEEEERVRKELKALENVEQITPTLFGGWGSAFSSPGFTGTGSTEGVEQDQPCPTTPVSRKGKKRTKKSANVGGGWNVGSIEEGPQPLAQENKEKAEDGDPVG
ncbi:hypothetical protein BKA70DRAFT_1261825 [Coprinopsis sp. MPI-PUGE-AT-0042]|nr:hypothetical protein BKA70DRAFT_1261825 [Coprinopsis sp. MPI-PUGE-AT-0042]